jgi:hypothetical protein
MGKMDKVKNLAGSVDKEAVRRKAQEAQGKFKKAVFDEEEGTFLGRNAQSWAKILAFYAIYYTLLLLLFLFTIQIFEWRIMGDNKPAIRTRLDEPGLTVFPHNSIIGNEDELNKALKYERTSEHDEDEKQANFEKIIDQYYYRIIKPNKESCHKNSQVRQYTDYLWDHVVNHAEVTGDHGFRDGLRKGRPVFLLKLNRIIGWRPIPITKAAPELLRAIRGPKSKKQATFVKDMVYFTCRDGDLDYDDEGLPIKAGKGKKQQQGNVKEIIFHNPHECGDVAHSSAVGCVPAKWYGEQVVYDKQEQDNVIVDNMYHGHDPWDENAATCENYGLPGIYSPKICTCQPFLAVTVKAHDRNQPVNVKCKVHLANVEAQYDNPANYGWVSFGFSGSGFPVKKNRSMRRYNKR